MSLRRITEDPGNAIVEFVGLSLVLLIPLAYLVLWLGAVQNASYAATTAAAESARIVAVGGSGGESEQKLTAAIASLAEDYGVDLTREQVTVTCSDPLCTEPGGHVRAEVTITVPLPGLGVIGLEAAPITVSAAHAYPIDEHAERGAR